MKIYQIIHLTTGQQAFSVFRPVILFTLAVVSGACIPSQPGWGRYTWPMQAQLNNDLYESVDNGPGGLITRRTFFTNGRPASVSHERNGRPAGTLSRYNEKGQLTYEVTYLNGQKNGWEKRRKRDGEYTRCQINNGILNGICYRSLGKTKEYVTGHYDQGKKTGDFLCYHKDGRVKVKGQYSAGIQTGKWYFTPRDPSFMKGYKVYYYDQAGKREKIEYLKTGEVDHNPGQAKFHSP